MLVLAALTTLMAKGCANRDRRIRVSLQEKGSPGVRVPINSLVHGSKSHHGSFQQTTPLLDFGARTFPPVDPGRHECGASC